jgi:hypothetical protein
VVGVARLISINFNVCSIIVITPSTRSAAGLEAEKARGPKKHNRCMLRCAEELLRWGMSKEACKPIKIRASRTERCNPASSPAEIDRKRTQGTPPVAEETWAPPLQLAEPWIAPRLGVASRQSHIPRIAHWQSALAQTHSSCPPIKSCYYWPLKRLSLIAFEHIGNAGDSGQC